MTIDIFGFALKPELSIGDFAAVVALIVSAITFYLGHTRSKKSEQIHISREIWDRIKPQEDIFENWTTIEQPNDSQNMKLIKAIDFLITELHYFVYLTEKGVVRDSTITEYYAKQLSLIIRTTRSIQVDMEKRRAEDMESDYKYKHNRGEISSRVKRIFDLMDKYRSVTGKNPYIWSYEDYEKYEDYKRIGRL